MKIKVFIFLLLIFRISSIIGQDFSQSLEYAFKNNQPDSLLRLLHEWNEGISSNETEVDNNSYESSIYSIFNEFYSPFNLNRIGSSEWGDSIYINKFAIVQNKLKYALAEFPDPDTIIIGLKEDLFTLSQLEQKYGKESDIYGFYENLKYPTIQDFSKIEILDFRPETNLSIDRRLYLTTYFQTELIQFLGNQHSPLGKGGIMQSAKATENTLKRQDFLNKYLSLIYGHWGGYWHLETHPEVSLIVIDPSSTKALVYFRLVYEGGVAYLERKMGNWVLIESKLTWIE